MHKRIEPGRPNQRLRTRKDLLAAAGRLLKNGQPPDMDQVAREAMVSRATAYRYFPSIEALLVEAPLDGEIPDPAVFFANDRSLDPTARVDRAEAVMHDVCYRNEPMLRLMLATSIARAAPEPTNGIPLRQNRRSPLISAALSPARGRISPATFEKLLATLALIFGPESMVVFRDVLGIDEKAARKIKSWAIHMLVQAALTNPRGK